MQYTRRWHSTTAATLGPGLVEVIMFGGSDASGTQIAANTILRFSELNSCHCPHTHMNNSR